MKTFLTLMIIGVLASAVLAQNKSLGVGITSPNANAALHVESPTNNQGFIMPRLTTTQRNAMSALLASGDSGLMLYDTDLKTIYIWNGTKWVNTTEVAGGARLSYPYRDSVVTSLVEPMLWLQYNNPTSTSLIYLDYIDATTVANPFVINHRGQGAAMNVVQSGPLGTGGRFNLSNAANSSNAIQAITNGTGNAIWAQHSGTSGYAGVFQNFNAANPNPSLFASTASNGAAFHADTDQGGNAVEGVTYGTGTGKAGYFENNNSSNSNSTLHVQNNGSGYGLEVHSTGTGENALFDVNNPTSSGSPVVAQTNGTGLAGLFQVLNSSAGGSALMGTTNSNVGGALAPVGVYGLSTGTGSSGGSFRINNAGSNYAALYAETNGTAMSLLVNHTGASGSLAVFQNNGANVARIDKTGQGFFNGGTQNGGADVAEMFDVEGERNEYEPGDVLVISESTDRTVEKSNSANSTKVAGVYATKPGVTLTERNIEENLDDLIPMGVIGVIPTKVCLENGPIKRGDLLVTSSVKGYAMKAIPVVVNGIEIYPTGAVIGKALENFEFNDRGLIKVLVTIK